MPEPMEHDLRVYLGQTRGTLLIETLNKYGFGEMTCRGELPPRRRPWAYDNGAFPDWTAGRPFDEEAFLRDCDVIARLEHGPDFVVLPDRVMGGALSLTVSMAWEPKLRGLAPLYLAVQDGMCADDVRDVIEDVDGLFVGGSLRWKVRTGEEWVRVAAAHGKPCHIGRVGTPKRVRWARRIKATGIDSCLPLWSDGHLFKFLHALAFDEASDPQMALP